MIRLLMYPINRCRQQSSGNIGFLYRSAPQCMHLFSPPTCISNVNVDSILKSRCWCRYFWRNVWVVVDCFWDFHVLCLLVVWSFDTGRVTQTETRLVLFLSFIMSISVWPFDFEAKWYANEPATPMQHRDNLSMTVAFACINLNNSNDCVCLHWFN